MPKALERTAKPDALKVQDNVERVLNPLLANPLLDGRLIEGVELQNGVTNEIEHGLQRVLKGWVVTRKYNGAAASIVYEVDQDTNPFRSKTLKLSVSGGAVTVDIYVF